MIKIIGISYSCNYKPTIKDKDGKDVVTPYEKLDEHQKKMLSKNDEAKMDSLITTHQGNKQVKDNKIDLFVQKYKEFTITDDETIDCAFSRFNTIITSLKALDESFSSRNHVRKFLRAFPSKWQPKVTVIEESKDLLKLSLDELVGNLKVYEIVLEKDLEVAKNKKEKYKSLALKAIQVLSDDNTSSSDSNDEEYAMAEDKKEERRCFRCDDPNHFISDFPKNFSGDQKAFVVGSWSDSGDDLKKEEICLMAHSNEVHQKVKLDPDEWIQDSGCTRYMIGNKDLFSSYKLFDGVMEETSTPWSLSTTIQVQKGCPIISIRTNHGREFDNEVQFGAFCDANGITHYFLVPRTPQSNGVVERKNRTLQEMARTMLNEQSIPQKFWCNAVDTSTYILNRILIRPFLGKTPYELFKGKNPSLEHFKVFGSKCFILNTKDYLTKFDPKSTEGVFLGYSPNSKAYIVLNKETMKIEESLYVKFDETPPPKSSPLVDDDILEIDIIEDQDKDLEIKKNELLNKEISNIKSSKDHPLETVI
ncbi:retrovirus-related pol polyprotein from transposon TNT 1-94 [Tanacetum coccineum]